MTAHIRIQHSEEIKAGWTQIMIFDKPLAEGVKVFSAEAEVEINCRRTIVYARDRGYNENIKAKKSYNMRFLFLGKF